MWLPINPTLATSNDLESLKNQILQDVNPTPLTCPTCNKALTRQPLSSMHIFVSACPLGHGFWIKPNEIRLAEDQKLPSRPWYTHTFFKVMISFIGIVVILNLLLVMAILNSPRRHSSLSVQRAFTPTLYTNLPNWNTIPIKSSSIDHVEDLSYLQKWTSIMNRGIATRLRMQDSLDHNKDIESTFSVFQNEQNAFLNELSQLIPPDHLRVFHRNVINAGYEQMAFYEEYMQRKLANPSLQLRDLLDNGHLKFCNTTLWDAYHAFQREFPQVDAQTNNAIESRLCQFDII